MIWVTATPGPVSTWSIRTNGATDARAATRSCCGPSRERQLRRSCRRRERWKALGAPGGAEVIDVQQSCWAPSPENSVDFDQLTLPLRERDRLWGGGVEELEEAA